MVLPCEKFQYVIITMLICILILLVVVVANRCKCTKSGENYEYRGGLCGSNGMYSR